MSKLYKELKYDTDWVMQPGDPITSQNGKNEVVIGNDGVAAVHHLPTYYLIDNVPNMGSGAAKLYFRSIESIDEIESGLDEIHAEVGVLVGSDTSLPSFSRRELTFTRNQGSGLGDYTCDLSSLSSGYSMHLYGTWCGGSSYDGIGYQTGGGSLFWEATGGHTFKELYTDEKSSDVVVDGGFFCSESKNTKLKITDDSGAVLYKKNPGGLVVHLKAGWNVGGYTTAVDQDIEFKGPFVGGGPAEYYYVPVDYAGSTGDEDFLTNAWEDGPFLIWKWGGGGMEFTYGQYGASEIKSFNPANMDNEEVVSLTSSNVPTGQFSITRSISYSPETLATEGHTHTEIVSSDGNTSVQAVNGGKATITMPGLAEPGASLSNDVTLADLIQLLDLPETSTLDDVRTALGLSETATLYDASVAPITKDLVTSPVKWEDVSNKPTSFAPAAHEHSAANITSGTLSVARGGTGVDGSSQSANKVLASPVSGTGAISFRALVAADIPDLSTSKLTTGTLGVARGGTGKISHTVNSVIIGGISTTGALQNVASASGAFYSTGSNKKPTFGTLPVAQGGTGVNGSSQAINKVFASPASGNAGAVSFRSLTVADLPTGTTSSTVALGNHTHSDYVSKSTTSNQNISGAITLVNTGNITVSPTSGGVSAGIGVASGNDAYVHASQDGVGGTEINPTGLAHYHPDGTVTDLTFPVPAKSGVIVTSTSLAENLNILPITTSTALSITMTADKYMYKVTDSGATGTFPTLTAPTGLPASCYYKFEMEWVTASPTATYAQTASTTPAMKWITSPVMQTDGLSHTYHISGRYDTTTSTFWMSCWKIDDAQGTIAPDSHTMKYLLTVPAQVVSTTTNTNDTITVQLSDHAINTVQVPTTATNVVMKFPGQAVGKARDFMVRLIVTGETVPSITLTEPDGSAIDFDVDDDSWTEIEQGVNLLMFTETAQ